MVWVEPLDLQNILVTIFAGTMEIFMFLSLIIIAIMAAYFRMLNATILIMYAVFGIIMSQYFTGIYFLVILIGGLVTAYAVAKIMK